VVLLEIITAPPLTPNTSKTKILLHPGYFLYFWCKINIIASILSGVPTMAATQEDFTIEKRCLLHVSDKYIEQHGGYFRIPPGVFHVDSNAFLNCPSLEHLEVPDSTGILPPDAIRNCPSLKQLTFDVRERKGVLAFYDKDTDRSFAWENLKITIIDDVFLKDHTEHIWVVERAQGESYSSDGTVQLLI